ncbi:MAG: hypothetical protein LBH20_01435 [Treponema sp.]|nr:hypothetical protein [Treponema sp.]
MNIFKNTGKCCVTILCAAVLFTTLTICQNIEPNRGEESGSLRITVAALSGYSDMRYEAVISSRTKPERTVSWDGSRIHTVELPAGLWNIALNAIDGDEVIAAENVKNVEIVAGKTAKVTIELKLLSEGGDPDDPDDPDDNGDPEPAVEEGILSITVTNAGSFPNGAVYALTLSCGGEALDKNLDAGGGGSFTLTAGVWDIVLSVRQDGVAIANASKTGIRVEKDQQTNVTLEPVVLSGTGTFSWTVNFPGGVSAARVTTAEMRIRDTTETAAHGYDPRILPLTGAPSDTVILAAGSWTVEFNMEIQWGNSSLRSSARRSYAIEMVKDQALNKTYTFDYKDFALLLEAADASGSAYPVIQSKGFDYESPDQSGGGDESFGPHIVQQYDAALGKNVFAFIMHRDNDRNATGDWTRQRVEIKVNHANGNPGRDYCALDNANEGRSFIYRWKFRLPADFAVSTDFTHIHQIKNEGGDAAQPVVALTARDVSGNKRLQLTYYAPGSSSPTYWENASNSLAPYLGQWVQCEETVCYSSNAAQASYSIKITRIDNGQMLMNYTAAANAIQTWRAGNTHGRPKYGLYRRIFSGSSPGDNTEPPAANAIPGLKDETALYADFEIVRLR